MVHLIPISSNKEDVIMRFRNLHEIPEEYRNLVELLIAKGVIAVNNGDFPFVYEQSGL